MPDDRTPKTYLDAALRRMPRWMRGTWFDRIWTAAFAPLDQAIDLAKQAALAAFLESCPDDAVEYHARARMMPRMPWESIGDLRERALTAWTFWSEVTGATGLRDALRFYSQATHLEIYDQANDNWLGGAVGVSFGDDGNSDNASRHAIVIPLPHPWERPEVGADLLVGPDTLVGCTMTATELSRLRWAYAAHRPANMVGIDVYVLFDATTPGDVLGAHDASSDYWRVPLHVAMVGYPGHGMVVGPGLVVGQFFT